MGAEGAAGTDTRPPRRAELARWLSNPLLVTVVAAVLGGLLIPYVTQRWQNHEKALEIKTGLVTQMAQSSSGTVATSRFLAARLIPRPADRQPIWNAAYRDWVTSSSTIGAKLQAYVSTETGDGWRSFGYALTDYLSLSVPASGRASQIGELQRLLPDDLRFAQKERAALGLPRTRPLFQAAYADLGLRLTSWRDRLIREVLGSGVNGF